MGTISDKLNNILMVKNRIKEYFSLPEDLPFYNYPDQVADRAFGAVRVTNGHLCTASSVEDVTLDYTDFTAVFSFPHQNITDETAVFKIEDAYRTGTYRRWKSEVTALGHVCRIVCNGYSNDVPHWLFYTGDSAIANCAAENPWDGTWRAFYDLDFSISFTTEAKQFEGKKCQWTGQQYNFYEHAYELGSTTHTQYYYGMRPPQVGHIYNLSGDVEIAWMYPDIQGGEGTSGGGTSGGGEFYLCSYVNRNYFSYNTIVVSGMPTDAFVGATYTDQETWESADVPADIAARDPNGTYTLTNPDATSASSYIWQSANGCVIAYNNMNMGFAIEPSAEYKGTGRIQMSSEMGSEYPVPEEYNTSNNWVDSSWNTIEGGSVAVPEPAPVEQYWEGYKLIQNESGKYDYATETTRLTYADYMPVAGRIYDGSCTMEITNANLSEDALWSCPHGMISNESDEWIITESGHYYDSTTFPINAFDGNLSTAWISNYSSTDAPDMWIQWQHKERKVLIPYLRVYFSPGYNLGDGSYFMGSDDGSTWTDIARGNISGVNDFGTNESIGGYSVLTFDFKGKPPCYQYYRLGRRIESSGYRLVVHHVEAYTQIPREVPK